MRDSRRRCRTNGRGHRAGRGASRPRGAAQRSRRPNSSSAASPQSSAISIAAVEKGRTRHGRARRGARAHRRRDRISPTRRRPRDRGRDRKSRDEARALPAARRNDAAGGDPGQQHVVDLDHEAGRGDGASAERVIGMHFMNPVPVMKLVEVIRGIATDATKRSSSCTIWRSRIGKTPVEVRDFPGFISNRVLMPMINEAIFALYEGVGTIEAIDTVMKLGHEPSDGAARAGRLHRSRHVPRDHGRALRGLRRSEVPAVPAAAQYVAAGWLGRRAGAVSTTTRARLERSKAGPGRDRSLTCRPKSGGACNSSRPTNSAKSARSPRDRAARDRAAHRGVGPRALLSARALHESSTTRG